MENGNAKQKGLIHENSHLDYYWRFSAISDCRPDSLFGYQFERLCMITRQELVDKFDAELLRLINKPIRETGGKNRSPDIDSWNRRVGEKMGSPYCAASIWCEWKDLCDSLGLKFPMPRTGSSQAFATLVPAKYIRKPGELGQKGDAGVLQLRSDKSHGHLTVLREDQKPGEIEFLTREFNTSPRGSRDGDGGYSLIRSTVDGHIWNGRKDFRCFANIPQWIIDFNS